jgi:hypothetical protein
MRLGKMPHGGFEKSLLGAVGTQQRERTGYSGEGPVTRCFQHIPTRILESRE